MGSGDPAAWAQRPSAGSSLAQHIPLVASSLRSPGAGAAVQLPAPRYWGPLAGPFSCSPQNGSCWGALPGPGSGRGWGSATQVDPPVLHLHVSTAPHGGSRDQGAWKAAVPQGPKKVSSSLNLGAGTFSPGQRWRSGRQTSGPTWQTRCGQQVALCCPVTGDSRGPFSPADHSHTPTRHTAASRSVSTRAITNQADTPSFTCDADDCPLGRVQDTSVAPRAASASPAPLGFPQVPGQCVPRAGRAAASIGAILGHCPHLVVLARHGLPKKQDGVTPLGGTVR